MTGSDTQILDGGRLVVCGEFVDLLRANELDTFASIMARTGGAVMRAVPGRSTVRVELRRPEGGTLIAFLKRYEPEYLSFGQKLFRLLRWPGARDEARHEWDAIARLRAAGFVTATPIAVGQQSKCGAVTRSFLLTAEIACGIAAHDHLRTLDAKRRRELALAIAKLTRRFHGAGFAHKDYYLSHILVVPAAVGEPALFFIDLQRLIRPRLFGERWRVKDLAALGYSAQRSGATRADLLRFYKACFSRQHFGESDRRLIRKIMARINSLHRRGPKYDVIWDQPGIHPPNV
jgi:heptose I phosphotransferase